MFLALADDFGRVMIPVVGQGVKSGGDPGYL